MINFANQSYEKKKKDLHDRSFSLSVVSKTIECIQEV